MYTINYPSGTLRKSGAVILQDDRTLEYREYVQWLAEGNGPQIIQDAPLPRITVSAWQIRKALNHLGLREAVESAVAAGDVEMQDGWQYATAFESDHALVTAMGSALGKTPEEMHEVFQLAEGM